MKKLIIFEIVVLVLLLALMSTFLVKPDLVSLLLPETTVAATEPPTEATEPPTEPPTEATEPPTEAPTEPPVTIELQDSWRDVLYGHTLVSPKYFVYDLTQRSFLTVSPDLLTEPVYPASITKLFTAYVALQYMDPEETVTVGSELSLIDADSSTAGLKENDTLTVEQLVAAMLLPSGNDAAYVLTAAAGRFLEDSPSLNAQAAVDRFVEQMNFQAKAEGMFSSHFVTPDGIHNEAHYISVPDLITIARLALEDPIISKYVSTASLELSLTEETSLSLTNTNLLLRADSEYYCPYAIGLKTGYTGAAGNCLLSTFQVEDQALLIGVFGCADQYDRYADTLLLFSQVYDLEIPAPDPVAEETFPEDDGTGEFAQEASLEDTPDAETIPEEEYDLVA